MGSETTGSREENQKQTGTTVSETGFGSRQHDIPPAPVGSLAPTKWPVYLEATVSAPLRPWIDYVNYHNRQDNTAELMRVPQPVAREIHLAAERISVCAQPPSSEEIVRWLTSLAGVFCASVPESDGLLLYARALAGINRTGLKQGIDKLIRTHRWPRLPFPAELIEASSAYHDVVQMYAGKVYDAAHALHGSHGPAIMQSLPFNENQEESTA